MKPSAVSLISRHELRNELNTNEYVYIQEEARNNILWIQWTTYVYSGFKMLTWNRVQKQ